ncbi:MAG: hypothetical protein JJT78_05170 [Leptospira sp.]|nr:hypothetical protein [Leptospira sp.]
MMFFKELWELNPLKLFFDTTQALPGISSNSKIIIFLANVSPLLHQKISKKRSYISELRVGSHKEKLILEGEVNPNAYLLARILKIRRIHFKARLKIVSIEQNIVRFQFISYSLDNTRKKKWDILRIISRFDPIHKKKILKTIVDGFPEVLRLTPIVGEVLFNLNYFLNQVPSLAGKIQVVNADLHNDRVVFHARSNVILKPLMDMLGPQYVKVTYRESGKYY